MLNRTRFQSTGFPGGLRLLGFVPTVCFGSGRTLLFLCAVISLIPDKKQPRRAFPVVYHSIILIQILGKMLITSSDMDKIAVKESVDNPL